MQRYIYRLLFFCFLLGSYNTVKAIDEKYAAPALRGNQLAADSTSMVMDTVYFNPALKPLQTTYFVKNLISFQIDESYRHALPDEFNVSVTFNVHYTIDNNGTPVTGIEEEITLAIEYSKYTTYKARAAFIAPDWWYKAEIEIVSINGSGNLNEYRDALVLTNEILINREYNFSCANNAIQNIFTNTTPTSTKGELSVYWLPERAADEYDLEWTYIDEVAVTNYYKSGTTQFDSKKLFGNNATRVSVRHESYNIPLLYEASGRLFCRVRAVQLKRDGQRIESVWSSDFTGGLGSYSFAGLDSTLNWQASTSFAEEGKRKSVVQYFDGSLKSRQTVTKDNTTDTTIIAETFYDYQGRPVIQVMPAPSLSSIIKFTPGFNRLNGAEYIKDEYDGLLKDSCYCKEGAPAMDSGAALYYSPQNPLAANGYHKYIPNANGYVFSETRYTPDNTGRISIQSGVGEPFQIGKGHETNYTYNAADQEELDALFGTEAGNASHYFKNTVQDANGQVSISYVDMHGRTIATALAGKPPVLLDTLASNKSYFITKKLLDSNSNAVKGTVIESSKGLVVTKAGQHRFIYSLLPDSISIKDCKDSTICYDCVYDLRITISDECNNTTMTNGEPVVIDRSNYHIDTACNAISLFPALDTTVYLQEGSYLVTKTLTVNQKAMDYYRDSIFLVRNTCKTLEQTIQEQKTLLASVMQCEATCAACSTALSDWETFRNDYMQQSGISNSDTANYRVQATNAYNTQQEECKKLCDSVVSLDVTIRQQMLADVTPPSGQYADPDNVDYYSVFWSSNTNTQNYKMVNDYKDENGQKENPDPGDLDQADFIANFKSSWAEALLKKHPEYLKLKKYEEFATSNTWDQQFEKTETYQEAVAKGYLNPGDFTTHPAGAIFAHNGSYKDPFFTDYVNAGKVSGNYKNQMQDSLLATTRDENNNAISMWSLATILANCSTSEASCVDQYKPLNNAFSIGGDCTGDQDMAWKYFRELYLQEKREIIAVILRIAQQQSGYFADLTDLANNHSIHFYDPALMPTGDMPADEQAARDSLQEYIDDNCTAYVNQWWSDLGPCSYNSTDSLWIMPRLIDVCREGGDEDHMFGASTVKPSSTYEYKSFEEVLKAYSAISGKSYNATCNAYLLSAPLPYDQQAVYTSKPVYQKPDSCECATISSLYQQYEFAGKDASFAGYLYRTTGTQMTQGALDTLLMACNGQVNCNYLPAPVYLPPVLQCGVKDVCVSCAQVDSLYQKYTTEFPEAVPRLDNNDSLQQEKNKLFERFMNTRLGFGKQTADYLAFMDTCGIKKFEEAICNQALNFSGTPRQRIMIIPQNQRIQLGTSNFTMEAKFKPKRIGGINGRYIILSNRSTVSGPYADGFVIFIENDGTIVFQLQGCYNYLTSGYDLFDDKAHHIALTRESDSLILHVDGIKYPLSLNCTNGLTTPPSQRDISSAGNLYISYDSVAASEPGAFNGWMSYVRIWNKARSEQEITENMDADLYPQDGLVGNYIMKSKDTCQQILLDQSTDIDSLRNNGVLGYSTADETNDPVWLSASQVSFTSPDPTGVTNNCGCSGTRDTLVGIKNEFLNDYYNYGIKYDSNGCDTVTWKATVATLNNVRVPHKDIFKNGIAQFPDSIYLYGKTKVGYDFVETDSACIDRHMSLEFRMKMPQPDRFAMEIWFNYGPVLNPDTKAKLHFQFSPTTSGNHISFYDWGILENNRSVIRTPEFWQDYSYWRIVKLEIKDSVVKFFVDDSLLATINFPSSIDLQKLKGFDWSSGESTGAMSAMVDWVKAYDKNNKLFYFEDFNDCGNFSHYAPYIQCPRQPCTTAFTNYYNQQKQTSYTYTQIESIYESHNISLNICDSSSLTLCGKTEPVFAPDSWTSRTACDDSTSFATSTSVILQEAYRDSLIGNFNDRYLAKCLSARYNENFTVYQPISEFHYTLYYYDQAGNLLKTVAPEGVDVSKFAWARAWSDSVTIARRNRQLLLPQHTMPTQYRYNTLNQVVKQQSPDGGLSEFWYDRLGRLAISRNARQKAASGTEDNRLYSYTKYDSLGRITEVGQVSNTGGNGAMTDAISRNQPYLENWLTALTSRRGQITNTVYDLPYTGFEGIGDTRLIISQRNLRNRVSYTTLTDTGASNVYNQATFYTYDILGNVDHLLQDYGSSSFATTSNVMNKNENRWKKISYQYDLISGKVNMVMYQHDWMDGFFHRYSYDAENRLTLVETSRDSLVWEKDARYDYYRHGPLARVTLGEQQVQGLDYAYTLQGWLKGINSTGGTDSFDMGSDAHTGSLNQYVAKDALGLTLNYFGNDYTAINGTPFPGYSGFLPTGAYRPLYNGNISSSSVFQSKFDTNDFPGGPLIFYNYKYDQLNRLTGQDAFTGFNSAGNSWSAIATMGERLKERIAYDANGNILKYLRKSISGTTADMDSLNYHYYAGTNQLKQVTDNVPTNGYNDPEGRIVDIDGQPENNYGYDAIGNLIKDSAEKISSIKWNVYGKIQEINRTATTELPASNIKYSYDAMGNRISQEVTSDGTKYYTWYVRDAQGNIMSTYKSEGNASDLEDLTLKQSEKYLYGSSRLGLITVDEDGVDGGPGTMQYYYEYKNYERGYKQYELTNHLGNVLVTISDRKFGVTSGSSSLISYYEPHIVTAQDYYPFGMLSRVALPNSGKTYKFGFNGKMNDNEVKGLGNQQDYGMRISDPRIGKFLSVDPITRQYPELTPYQFGSNNPVQNIDLDGLEGIASNMGSPGKYHIPGDANDDGFYSKQELKQGTAIMGVTALVVTDALVTKGALTKNFGKAMVVWGFLETVEYTNRNSNQHDPKIRAENDKKAKGAAIDLAVGYGIGKTVSVLTKLIGEGGKVIYKYFASSSIRFSQSSVNGLKEIVTSMEKNGWKGDPIDIVKMKDGIYTSVDNTRLLAAKQVGIEVKANAHNFSDIIPEEMAVRFANKNGVLPKTWGEAVKNRIANQNKSFRSNENGSFVSPTVKE